VKLNPAAEYGVCDETSVEVMRFGFNTQSSNQTLRDLLGLVKNENEYSIRAPLLPYINSMAKNRLSTRVPPKLTESGACRR
jgi:hypothetical protein